MPSPRRWYANANAGDACLRLLQCDLGSHSTWFEQCRRAHLARRATVAKKRLAAAFEKTVARWKFDRVFWRGDGGLYAARQTDDWEKDAKQLVLAARAVRKQFLEWQTRDPFEEYARANRPSLEVPFDAVSLSALTLRVSCEKCDVWVERDPGYWTSTDLNDFLKHERQIAHHDAISITDAVKRDLDLAIAKSFVKENSKEVSLGERRIRVWFDGGTTGRSSTRDAREPWFAAMANDRDPHLVTAWQKFTIDDAVVLALARFVDDPLDVQLVAEADTERFEDDARWSDALKADERVEWGKRIERISSDVGASRPGAARRVDRVKASPISLRLPLLDFPVAEIRYVPTPYTRGRSFLSLVADSYAARERDGDGLWRRLAVHPDYRGNAPQRPGLLGGHIVVILTGEASGPCVVLAQRSDTQPGTVGFHLGRWSASMEEQFEKADRTVEQWVRRGLEEELLGEKAADASMAVCALLLERSILNLGLGVVCSTPLSVRDVFEAWSTCGDRNEHVQIAALPLRKELVRGCVEARQITETARQACIVPPELKHVWEQTSGWNLHPTSAFRLALAYWFAEQRAWL